MKTVADVQIAGDIHVVDGDQSRLADREFAADDFANLALQQFAHALKSEGGMRLDVKASCRSAVGDIRDAHSFCGDLLDRVALDQCRRSGIR